MERTFRRHQSRGVEKILLFISDGLKGLLNSIFSVYPASSYQICCIHLSRTVAHKFRVSDRAEICEDFESVYRAESLEMGQQALHSFVGKWKATYPKVTKPLLNNPYLFTFSGFPKSIWRSIYSTNLIESFNKPIKKYSKHKEQFPHEELLERFLVSQFDQYNQRFARRCHIGLDQARAELQIIFTTN